MGFVKTGTPTVIEIIPIEKVSEEIVKKTIKTASKNNSKNKKPSADKKNS